DKSSLLADFKKAVGFPFVIKAPYQGSSIGISVINSDDIKLFTEAINKSFFIQQIELNNWAKYTKEQKITFLKTLTDIREGIGLPVVANEQIIKHPEDLLKAIDDACERIPDGTFTIESLDNEEEIIIEAFIGGKEFSCIVVQDDQGKAIALPPTEIVKGNKVFDYRSKYLPGMTRKITPINLPSDEIEKIREECERLFNELRFNVYARIDGFITEKAEIFLNDPNTTSGMLPSSFFFHQAAEIGLNPSQFLTYIIRTSITERIKSGKKTFALKQLASTLDKKLAEQKKNLAARKKIAIVMGGFSSERHISVESGRNIYEKLSSSTKYEPIPVFLTGDENEHLLYIIPVNIMLKDNADDIKEKVLNYNKNKRHPILDKIIREANSITETFSTNVIFEPIKVSYSDLAEKAEAVFIALHGRPGEDGAIQKELEKYNLPYNGSGIHSSGITINKFETNKILRENGIHVANHKLIFKENWIDNKSALIEDIEKTFKYPFIAKPADDGCSSAVKKIKTRPELEAFCKLMFGQEDLHDSESAKVLNLKYNEEFPLKNYFLIEDLITKGDAKHFLEVTGGLLTSYKDGKIDYEMFEPSETLAFGDILSLEEKFLAGEGQNITPARFAKDKEDFKIISSQVRTELKKVAEILKIEGYARIDAFVRVYENNRAETIVIEVNSLPGMTPATCIFHQTALNGYKPYDFIDNILTFGIERVNNKKVKI
ncbi:MAG TPA: D-alanine--D-alanine ligase, partial [Cytophagaceae bacterium]